MNSDLIVYNIGQLVTCASSGKPKRGAEMSDVGIIEKGALAIADGKVAGIGRSDEILREFSGAETIDVERRVVCPGFVDPHTHIVFAGNRLDEFELRIKGADYLEILASGGGILSTVAATRAAICENLIELAMERLDKMLACGTTTVEIKTGYGLDAESELKMLRVIEELDRVHPIDIVPTFLAAHAVPPEYRGKTEAYVDLICSEMLPRAWAWYEGSHFNGDRPFFTDVFCERNAFDVEQSARVFDAAKKLGFRLKAHVDEFSNLGGSRMAIETGAVSIDHLDAISGDEVALLASSNTIGVITPTVNFNLGSREYADARALIDVGCAVAISTDNNPGSAPCPSQQMAMAITCRYQKLTPAEAFNAATINAAFACGVSDVAGSLEVGKNADILVLATDDYREAAYQFGGNLVKNVIKSGKLVL